MICGPSTKCSVTCVTKFPDNHNGGYLPSGFLRCLQLWDCEITDKSYVRILRSNYFKTAHSVQLCRFKHCFLGIDIPSDGGFKVGKQCAS